MLLYQVELSSAALRRRVEDTCAMRNCKRFGIDEPLGFDDDRSIGAVIAKVDAVLGPAPVNENGPLVRSGGVAVKFD